MKTNHETTRQVFKNNSGVHKAFRSKTQNIKAIKDKYVMLEYIVIKMPSTKLNNKHHAGN